MRLLPYAFYILVDENKILYRKWLMLYLFMFVAWRTLDLIVSMEMAFIQRCCESMFKHLVKDPKIN
jgi:hypothetical protein